MQVPPEASEDVVPWGLNPYHVPLTAKSFQKGSLLSTVHLANISVETAPFPVGESKALCLGLPGPALSKILDPGSLKAATKE